MSEPIHVMAYTDATGRGGGEMSLGHLVGALDPAYRVTVAGVAAEVVDWIAGRRPGAERVLLPVVRGRWDVTRSIVHVHAIRRARPDVLHANLRVPASCWYGIVGGLATPGTATVAVEQLPIRIDDARHRRWTRFLHRRLDAHVAVGEESARRTERFVGLSAGTVRSIPNYVPDVGPAARTPHDGVVLAAVGRLDPQKGFDVLLAALPSVPGVALRLIGGGRLRGELERQAVALGLADRVTFTEWSEDVRGHLAGADVLVLPSRSEGFPLTIVEAMLAGLPVVATAVGSVPEAVREGETGLLVPKDDPAALAAALRTLAADPALRAHFGTRGRALAAAELTAPRMARAYESLYAGISERRTSARSVFAGAQTVAGRSSSAGR